MKIRWPGMEPGSTACLEGGNTVHYTANALLKSDHVWCVYSGAKISENRAGIGVMVNIVTFQAVSDFYSRPMPKLFFQS